jgi:two-component system OmpR family response regulator
VTFEITLPDDTPDPVALLRGLVERVHEIADPTAPAPIRLVEARPPDPTEATAAVAIDLTTRTVRVDGAEVALCRREFDLRLFLADHAGQVLTRHQLLAAVWNNPLTGERTVDVHIRRLRQKIGTHRLLVTTLRGVGYRLSPDAPIAVTREPFPHPDPIPPTGRPTTRPAARRTAR